MRRYFLILVICPFVIVTCYAQAVTLKGKVFDAENGDPIPFVSIGLVGDYRGTVSNENGEYAIKVDHLPTNLIFSHLSYRSDTVSVLKEGEIEFGLQKAAIQLQEVVYQDNDYITSLLAKAYGKLSNEYEQNTYSEAFYRQITKIDGRPTEVQEIVYYAKTNSSRVLGTKLKTGRYAANDGLINFTNFSIYFKMFGLHSTENTSEIAVIHPRSKEKYNLRLVKFLKNGADEIAEIAFTCKGDKCSSPTSGAVYINTETYEVKRFEIDILGNMNFKIKSPFRQLKPDNYDFKWIADFSQLHGKTILDYIKVNFSFDLQKKEEKHPVNVSSLTYFYNNSFARTKIDYSAPNPRINDRDAIKSINYDPEFWKNSSIVQRTPLEEEVIEAFEEKGSFGSMISE